MAFLKSSRITGITARDVAVRGFRQSNNINLGTRAYTRHEVLLADNYSIKGDVTVSDDLILSKLSDDGDDITITGDTTTRTISGSGSIQGATLAQTPNASLTSMTGTIGTGVTFPAGHIIKVYNKTLTDDDSTYSQNTSYFEPGVTNNNGEFTLTCTPATAGNKFLVMVSYMPGFKAPSSDDMSGFVELYGGLTSSQSQLWEVEMRTDNMGKLGDYLNHMPFAVVRNFSFTTTSTAEHTFKVRCKCSTSARWIYHLMNGGDITIMELQG